VAAVCVYPTFIKTVKDNLKGSDINIASVAAGFPSGQTPLFIKREEVRFAVDQGADEIDIVISRGKLIEGEYNEVFDEIMELREASSGVHLKVILETGELESVYNIRKASELAINAGADFIKTSTGKIKPAATERAMLIMIDTIKEYFTKTGKKVGIKPAGGISEPHQVLNYYIMVNGILGEQWLNKDYFRIGASRLADNLFNEILTA
jgi:deoxyribose-phosphate aldolase